jgi:PBP superfamily domain
MTFIASSFVLSCLILVSSWNHNNVMVCGPSIVESMENTIVQIHGSGTTNPSKCIWNIMNEFMYSSSIPIRMTFRSIGTVNSIDEFIHTTMNYTRMNTTTINEESTLSYSYNSLPVFSIGDYALSTNEYQLANGIDVSSSGDEERNVQSILSSNESMIIQLPIMAGAVNFFYHIPNVDDLYLNACLLARIYTLNITVWDHPDIVALNPSIVSSLSDSNMNESFPIKVMVRDGKAGSALAITSVSIVVYLSFFVTCFIE